MAFLLSSAMGQQQILLLLLVTVIVGIATVIAINSMEKGYENSNRENITQELLNATSRAQMYYRKNSALGGGGNSFNGITMNILQIDTSGTMGTFTLSEVNAESVVIEVDPASEVSTITGTITIDGITIED